MDQSEVMQVLESNGGVLRGHFRLTSGRHSDVFVQKFRIFEHPRLTQSLGDRLAAMFDETYETVASPAVGAIVLGFAVALAEGARMVFAEREEGSLRFRRGFMLRPHERVLIVEDVVTTGGSVREVLDLVRSQGAEPVGIACLIDRGDRSRLADLGVPVRALVHMEADSWAPQECPLCGEGRPIEEPGSRRIS